MAALDVETRESVRSELDVQLAEFEGCAILVTHDPLDAMLLADRVLVLEGGAVVQDATPTELALQPATPYVAALMGVTLLRGTVHDGRLACDDGGTLLVADHAVSGRVMCVVRPESVTLHRTEPEGSARNVWSGVVSGLQPSHDRVRVTVAAAPGVTAVVTPAAVAELGLTKGTPVWLSMKAVDLAVYRLPAH
jgi:molybdate transport system ATP-binding protein